MDYKATGFPFTIMDVASLLRLNIRREGSGHIYVDCPICGDRRGKMNLNLTKNVWRCNYCGEGGGMLALYAKVYRISNSDAYKEICDALQTGSAASAYSTPSPAGPNPQAERASEQEIHRTFTTMMSALSLTPAHREHLRSKRGLTDAQIDQFGFKSTPPPEFCRILARQLAEFGCRVQGVPGFYIDDYGKWTIKFHRRTSGILIPVRSVEGLLCGLQTSLDKPIRDKDDPPEKSGIKYLTLSSTGKNMGTTSKCPVHFAGDPCSRAVYVTEGALKADIVHALTGRSLAAMIGANNTAGLDEPFAFLRKNGTEEIIEAEDMDKYSKDMVSKGASKVCQLAIKHGMTCRRLVWNPNYKGIDDWQLDLEGIKTYPFAFRSIEVMRKAGYQQPPAADYRLVYNGEIPCAKDAEPKDVLERIFIRCSDTFPEGYRGHSLSMSGVVELYDEKNRSYFYCDQSGFVPVQFSAELAKPLPEENHGA